MGCCLFGIYLIQLLRLLSVISLQVLKPSTRLYCAGLFFACANRKRPMHLRVIGR